MNKYVYLAWQDQINRDWHVIGRLLHTKEGYEFKYTKGAKDVSFSVLPSMPEFDKTHNSTELFSLFKNRLMPKSRPEYNNYINWMDIEKEPIDELQALAISGGERETDFFRIIPAPEKEVDGSCSFKFFVNGLSHMEDNAKERVKNLDKGDPIYLSHDFQNKEDKLALLLRTDDPPCLIGYMPAYFTKIIHKLKETDGPEAIKVNVVKVNNDAPIQMRLLCELSFSSFKGSWEQYEDQFELLIP